MFSWTWLLVALVHCQLFGEYAVRAIVSTQFVMDTTMEPLTNSIRTSTGPVGHVGSFRSDTFQAEPNCHLATSDSTTLDPFDGDTKERRPFVYSVIEQCSLLECARECGASDSCAGYAFTKSSNGIDIRGYTKGTCSVVKSVPANESDLVVVCQQDEPLETHSTETLYKKVGFDERTGFVAQEVNDSCFNGGSWDGRRCQCTGSWIGHHCDARPKDCWDLDQDRLPGSLPAGVYHYSIQLEGSDELLDVACNQGWTYIQRRAPDASCNHVNFYQPWDLYREGFGSLDCDFWLGNENIHTLTSQSDRHYTLDVEVCLQVDVISGGCDMKHARYDFVEVQEEDEKYGLVLGDYVQPPWITIGGTEEPAWSEAGDALRLHSAPLAEEPTDFPHPQHSQDHQLFSTYDHDNDHSDSNCAEEFQAGWWYNNCTSANPNGPRLWTNEGIREAGEISIFWNNAMENFTLSTYSVAGIALRVRPANLGGFP